MAKPPVTTQGRSTRATPAKSAAVGDGDTIRMLTGQEGPDLSRVRGQLLEVGKDIGSTEATRLIDATFAEPA